MLEIKDKRRNSYYYWFIKNKELQKIILNWLKNTVK